jgi:drug/metabolite transporter (DMT)-like permease
MAVAIMWAATFVTFKVAWRDVDPVAFTGIRFALMVLFSVVVLAAARGHRFPDPADAPRLIAAALCGYFLYQLGFVLGLSRTSALAGAILISTHPIFAVMYSWIGRRERPEPMQVAGVALGFFGVAVFLQFWDAFGAAQLGDLFSLGAAAAFGAYGVLNQPLGKRYPTSRLMAWELIVGGTLTTLIAVPAMLHQDWAAVSGQSWLIIVYATVGPVYLAYAMWNWAIRKRGIARTVVYGFLVPVLGGAMAVVFLNEHVTPSEVVGALLVVAGLVVTRRPRRAAREVTAQAVEAPSVAPAASAEI